MFNNNNFRDSFSGITTRTSMLHVVKQHSEETTSPITPIIITMNRTIANFT